MTLSHRVQWGADHFDGAVRGHGNGGRHAAEVVFGQTARSAGADEDAIGRPILHRLDDHLRRIATSEREERAQAGVADAADRALARAARTLLARRLLAYRRPVLPRRARIDHRKNLNLRAGGPCSG